ncbi:hypothetical protein BCJMU51_5258 [Bacillus cereus]|nr:serine acetyltransferase [Bacillus cereus]BCB40342.1 hypothetical protein BCM0045_5237 [Bacillus cereus]BCC03176.1 hypothetical protein BCM0057_5258 [Bacillus cereus]BCC26692.1 hypothetical protein BCM0079_5285 [Bacillus cereus]BCC38256.1 hypothetical protein BCM0105_5246 [Bacillus cereus]BCC44053.1 hypothetical protein BCJMU01_5220 [Bacillus cereus]
MRKAEKLLIRSIDAYKRKKLFRAKIYHGVLRSLFSCDILYTADIDETVELVHNGLGCVFHPDVKIEKNCRIYQNVTLGGNGKIVNGEATNKGGPHLEQNVTVFSGACVLGPITIGQGSIIGANAVVIKDVPPNSIAVGVPAVIKPNNTEYNFGN